MTTANKIFPSVFDIKFKSFLSLYGHVLYQNFFMINGYFNFKIQCIRGDGNSIIVIAQLYEKVKILTKNKEAAVKIQENCPANKPFI